MGNVKTRFHTFMSLLATFSLFVQATLPAWTVLPQLAPTFAQEETPAPTPVPTPTEEVSPTPTEEVSPTPTEEVTPTIEPTPTETPTPTEEITPTPTPEQLSPTPTEVPQPTETGPPSPAEASTQEGQILDGVSTTATPTPTITPEQPKEEGELQAVILENVEAQSLDLDNVDPNNSATLTSDKADYAPTDTAVITGTDFTPGETYTLTISSDDPPPTSTTVEITADENGSFVYAYQLDGTYRPNYKVEAKSNATVVAETSFTDSAFACQNDIVVNDEPGQKDLTRMCADYSPLPTTLDMTWNWDDDAWPGGNTGDACALFDTDSDGNANFALCVVVGGDPAAYQSKQLYSCNDTKDDRCAGKSAISSSTSTSCSASIQSTDPFPTGSGYPEDTTGSCTLLMSDISASAAELIDVCSYPSNEPNSDPSDCIIATNAQTGTLEIIKQLSPTSDSGKFNLLIDSSVLVSDVGHNGTTGEQQVLSSGGSGTPHTFGEAAGTGTSLSDYTTTAACVNAAGAPVSITGTNPWTVNITNNADITCTITNTRINNASLTIVKDAAPNDPQDFTFTTSGTGLSNFNLDDDADGTLSNTQVFSGLAAGTYSVAETVPTGWVQTSATCDDDSPVNAIILSAGENVTCTFTNTKKGHVITDKVTDPSGESQSFDFVASGTGYSSFSLTDAATPNDQELLPGTYGISETVPTGWDLTDTTCVSSIQDTETAGGLELDAGETITCTFTNTQRGHIIVDKITNPSGSDQSFDFDATGSGYIDFSLTDAATANDQEVVPGSYSVSEGAVSGWDSDSGSCDMGETPASLDVGPGETVTCTFTNTQRGSISGYKYEDKSGDTSDDGDQTPVEGLLVELWQWVTDTFVDTGKTDTTDSNGFYEFLDLIPGVYQVREILSSLGAAWTNVTSTEIDVTVDPGESDENNNFINTRYGTIVVEKQTVPDGDQTLFDFDLSYGDNDADLSDGQQDSTGNLLPGPYSVSENTPEGWVLTDTTCTSSIDDTETADDLELDSGETITCVFTNSRKPTLTLVKTVINNNGGTAVANDFQGKINGGNVPWSVAQTLNPGSYTASETTLPNYTASVWGTNCNADGTITLAYGDNKTCSITNDDNAPALHLRKTITTDNGGTASITDWTLTATGTGDTPTNLSGSTPVDSGSGFKADTYALAESGGPSEYTAGTWDCGQATKTDPTHVVVPFGGDVTCTINNNDNAPSLTLNKVVVNDNGGNALESDWTLTATGPTSISGPGATGDSDVVSGPSFDAGTYTLSESTGPAGYTASSWSCSGGSQNGNEITIDLGESATCTITNDDIAPTITLIKEVVNDDGGEAGAGDFTLSLGNNTVTSGVATTVEANTAYEVDEAGPLGYQFVSITGDPECPGALAGNVTADEGENITCTITNNDIAPTLKLVKEVVIDNGGTAVADDWSLYASAYPNDSRNFNNLGGSGSFETVFANVGYDLSESSVSGYSAGSWNCNGGNLVGSTVTLGLNEDVTCTITNNDETGRLVIVKVLINDDGGDLNNEDFSYTVNDGISTPFESDGQNEESVDSGNYTIVEDEVTGYETTYENCEDIFVPNGGSATCTITNDDIAPTLKLVKSVSNDDGGDAVPADWDLTASGDGGFTDGGDSTIFHTVKANEPYTLSESTVTGYAEGSWDCDNAGLEGNVVLLGPGEEVTCTITNDDIAPTITLTKEVIGGTAGASDFSLYLGGDAVTSGVANTVLANFAYDIDEDGPSGYSFTSLTGDPECPDVLRGDVQAEEGENISCTITNTRDTGSLTVNKVVDTDGDEEFEGDNDTANNLGFVWGIDSETPERTMGETASTLETGTYNVDENSDVPDYHFVGWYYTNDDGGSCEDNDSLPAEVTVSRDETTDITLCNARDTGNVTVIKNIDGNNDGDLEDDVDQTNVDGWTWDIDGGEQDISTGESRTLVTDTYTLTEDEKPGEYAFVSWSCDNDTNGTTNNISLSLNAGDETTCAFTNTPVSDVHGFKWNDADGDGQFGEEDRLGGWTIFLDKNGDGQLDEGEQSTETDSGEELGWYWFYDLLPGNYRVCEVTKPGWLQTYPTDPTCHEIALPEEGEQTTNRVTAVEHNFGNQFVNPDLFITKTNDAAAEEGPGGDVTFTITVSATASAVMSVVVKDLPSLGFKYHTGSWSATKNGVPFAIPEPTYASPGTWTLGDMAEGDVIVLTYIADISSSIQSGLYRDLAWAAGTNVLSDEVIANDDTGVFVGTEVNVVKTDVSGASIKVVTEGEVLGASTELPATGASTLWLAIAGILGLTGVISMTLGQALLPKPKRSKRRLHA